MEAIKSRTKKCLYCAERIQGEAIKCRFCGEFLNTPEAKILKTDPNAAPSSTASKKEKEKKLFVARPSLWGLIGSFVRASLFLTAAVLLIMYPIENMLTFGQEAKGPEAVYDETAGEVTADELTAAEVVEEVVEEPAVNVASTFAIYRVIAGIGLAILVPLILIWKVINLKMTRYEVTADRIEWSRGVLDRKVDNLDMFRVVDMSMRRSLFDCVTGIGSVVLVTTDKSDPKFVFRKIHNPRKLYDVIKNASLEADRRNSVVHLE